MNTLILTAEDLQAFSTVAHQTYDVGLYWACTTAEINTVIRMQYFMAQVAYESLGFTVVEENLNYSAPRLLEVFPTHFTQDNAGQYAGHPQAIANRVYANRMGNGDEASGDGWTFHGRGLIQLTGRDNYTAMQVAINREVVSNPDWLTTPYYACEAASWFWNSNNLNKYSDAQDFVGLTRAINGGLNGLSNRQVWLSRAQSIWH